MLDVRRLRLLRELKIRGTLAAVATALHQSPSSVSQQLALLEKEVGVDLFRKVGRKVQLTTEAEILVEHTTAVLERLEQAESDLAASLEEASGTLRLVAFQSVVLALIPATLTVLARDHPRLRVTLTQREPENALYETWARDFDLVIAEQHPGHAAPSYPELDRMDLTTDAIRLAVPPAGRRWSEVAMLGQAADAPWVMEPQGTASRIFAEQVCRAAGFEPDVQFETADLQAQVRLIESGNAVALLPSLLWMGQQPSVQLHDLDGMPRRTIFTATRRASSRHPAVVACREALAAAVGMS